VTEEQIIWVKQLKQGNELAAYNIYKAYSKTMYNTLIRISGDSEIAKDLLQDGFVKALKSIHQLEDTKAFPGWIKRIIVNTGLEYVRSKQFVFEDINVELEEPVIHEEEKISDEALHEAIKDLPDGCRTVLSLHLLEGLKHSEIAKKLNISESTSKSQFRHAKKLLKKKLDHFYEN